MKDLNRPFQAGKTANFAKTRMYFFCLIRSPWTTEVWTRQQETICSQLSRQAQYCHCWGWGGEDINLESGLGTPGQGIRRMNKVETNMEREGWLNVRKNCTLAKLAWYLPWASWCAGCWECQGQAGTMRCHWWPLVGGPHGDRDLELSHSDIDGHEYTQYRPY